MSRVKQTGRFLWAYLNDTGGVSIRAEGITPDVHLSPGHDFKAMSILMQLAEACLADEKEMKRKKKKKK